MLRFFSSRNLSFTVTVHKWHEPYVVQQFSTKPLRKYQMIPAAAQRRRHRGDRWNFSLQFSLQTLCLEFSQIFTKNDVLFCNMAIAMNSWTWSPRVGFRIFVGIALGCFQVRRNVSIALCIPRYYQLKEQSDQSNFFSHCQVLFVVNISKQFFLDEIDETFTSKYVDLNFRYELIT